MCWKKSISNCLVDNSLQATAFAGLEDCNCEARVARATFYMACPTRHCYLIVFNTFIDLAAFPTTARMRAKLQYLVTPRMLILSTLETSGIHGGLFMSLRHLEWTIISSDLFVLSLWLFCTAYWETCRSSCNWLQIRGIADIRVWTQGRALHYTGINWLNERRSADK